MNGRAPVGVTRTSAVMTGAAMTRVAMVVLSLAVALVSAGAQATDGGDSPAQDPAAQASDHGLRGLVPRVRLFCSPCFDGYAQEMWVRSLRWEHTAIEDGWTRRRGAMFVPPVPAEFVAPAAATRPAGRGHQQRAATTDHGPTLLINDTVFDPATVYVRYRDEWVNLAIAMGLPGRQALPTLPPYIQVQQAPIPEEPRGEWGR